MDAFDGWRIDKTCGQHFFFFLKGLNMSDWLPWPPPHKNEVLTEDGFVFWMSDIGYYAGWYFSTSNREDGAFDRAYPKWYIELPPIPDE